MSDLLSGGNSRKAFNIFKSNICHYVKDMGDISFIIEVLETDEIRRLYNNKWYPEAFYLLAMIDYLSRENQVPLCGNYDDIRCCKLSEPLFPAGVLLASAALDTAEYKKEALEQAIPEFIRFNIVESEIRNVC